MIDQERVDRLIVRYTSLVNSTNPTLLREFPLEQYCEFLDSYPEVCGLCHVSFPVEKVCAAIETKHGKPALELYHKLVLLRMAARAEDTLPNRPLPTGIRDLFSRNFERIVSEIERDVNGAGFYQYGNSQFHKELAVCSLRLIPCGARKVHIHGLSKGVLLQGGLRQLFRAMPFIAFEIGGLSPLYECHVDSHDSDAMAEFNPEGWMRTLRRIAELLRLNQPVRGVFAASWFYDPELDRISPRLKYLRELAQACGGKSFCLGPCDANGVKLATLKSPTRRRLYDEGKYTPMQYALIWPRNNLIDWADGQR